MHDLKKLIKSRRKELGLKLLDIAKACNVSEATVPRWESGDIGDMKRSRIAALAKILQISPSIIVGTDEDDENDYLGNHKENHNYLKDKPELLELYEDIVANDKLVLLFDKAKKLNPEDLEQILKIIGTFNKETRWLYGFEDFLRFYDINLNYFDIPSSVRRFAYYSGYSYLVVINQKYNQEQNIKTTIHELTHIFENHFTCFNDVEEKCEKEVQKIIKDLKLFT